MFHDASVLGIDGPYVEDHWVQENLGEAKIVLRERSEQAGSDCGNAV